MKNFITLVIMLIMSITISNVANAQFVGGETTKHSGKAEVVLSWDMFSKSLCLTDDGYIYTYIVSSPRETPEGKYVSTILTLSFGKTKEECVSTLNAYKDLYNAMEKNEYREITDVTTETTYTITKNVDGIINGLTFNAEPTESGQTIVNHSGLLTVKDIDKMLKKMLR